MISFDEAQAILAALAQPLGSENVPLAEAAGRRLAAPVTARIDQPRADQSAMDGYAVKAGDAATLDAMRLIGEARPGAPFAGQVNEGEAVRIFTGAPVPDGADRVLVQEIVTREGDIVRVSGSYESPRHIRRKGADFVEGAVLLEPGQMMHHRALLAAAGSDNDRLTVRRRPRVALIATGDELAEPGKAAQRPHAIAESLSTALAALIGSNGGTVAFHRRLPDDLPLLERAAGEALAKADLIVTMGGASVGEHDHARAMFEPHGLDLAFSKVAIKPGKPVWLGRAKGRYLLGLPGNPTSAMVTARLFLLPLLARLAGGETSDALHWRALPIAGDLPPTGPRETFRRGIERGGELILSANTDSGAQAALVHVDRLIRCPAGDTPIPAGTLLQTVDF